MGRLKLCFGIKVDAGEWGSALGIKQGEKRAKTCSFCAKGNPSENNFCGNCGCDLRQAAVDMNPIDVVELTLSRLGGPPTPVQLLPGKKDHIYMCQVLATGDNGFVAFQKPIERFPWPAIDKAIRAYADLPDMDAVRPYLFAIDEDREEK